MHSEFGRRPGTVYRLIVTTPHDELVCDAPVFRHYKRAVSHIPAAVRRHARDGNLRSVILQRGRPHSPSDSVTWTALERWDNTVIERILRQQGHAARDNSGDSQRRADAQCRPRPHVAPRVPRRSRSHTIPASRPAPASKPHISMTVCPILAHTVRPKSHRWHWGLALAIAAWITIAAVVNNGGWPSWLPIGGPNEPAVATELPFDAPAAAASDPWDRSQAASQAQ